MSRTVEDSPSRWIHPSVRREAPQTQLCLVHRHSVPTYLRGAERFAAIFARSGAGPRGPHSLRPPLRLPLLTVDLGVGPASSQVTDWPSARPCTHGGNNPVESEFAVPIRPSRLARAIGQGRPPALTRHTVTRRLRGTAALNWRQITRPHQPRMLR